MLEVSIEELVKNYPDLMVNSTRESIIRNSYKLRSSVKEALILQLQCCYESVEYVAGRKGTPSKFRLDKLKEVPDEYLGSRLGGRPEIDFSEEFLLLNKWVSDKQSIYDQRYNMSYSTSRIIKEAYELKDLNQVVEIILLETENSFKAPRFLKKRGYNQADYEREQLISQSKELSRVYTTSIIRLQKQIVERWLRDSNINYTEVYMAKNGNKFDVISKEKYDEYKFFEAYHRKLSEDLNMKSNKIEKNITKLIRNEFNFDFAYIAYNFQNNEKIKDNFSSVQVCRKNLYNRLLASAERANISWKMYPEGWNIENDNLSIRLKRLREFKDFSEVVWGVVFSQFENSNIEINRLINEVNQMYMNKLEQEKNN